MTFVHRNFHSNDNNVMPALLSGVVTLQLSDGPLISDDPLTTTEDPVREGISFLDEHYGRDWPHRINLESFGIQDGRCCLLGQLEGGWSKAVIKHQLGSRECFDYGFVSDPCMWGDLNRRWIEEIKRLREERSFSSGDSVPEGNVEVEPTAVLA